MQNSFLPSSDRTAQIAILLQRSLLFRETHNRRANSTHFSPLPFDTSLLRDAFISFASSTYYGLCSSQLVLPHRLTIPSILQTSINISRKDTRLTLKTPSRNREQHLKRRTRKKEKKTKWPRRREYQNTKPKH